MTANLDEDAVIAAADVIGRTGAVQFEFGHDGDDDTRPATEVRWHASAMYRGARVFEDGHPGPVEAAEALARKLLAGGLCTNCNQTITLSGPTEQAGHCRWTRQGRRWERGCPEPAAPVDEYPWERRRDGEPTSEYLARVLIAAGLVEMAQRARLYHFDDFRAPNGIDHGDNTIRLLAEVRARIVGPRAGMRRAIAQAVIDGEFDATVAESRAWAASNPDAAEAFAAFLAARERASTDGTDPDPSTTTREDDPVTKTREQHIEWCRARALAELDAGGPNAIAAAVDSMTSDLRKHQSTAADAAHGITGAMPVGVELAHLELISGTGMRTADDVREWIQNYR
ncbi:hypothetical protein ACTD5D_00325 [Nocardia takedensis]|uniref:hypothetical protein n=1 Tax=Nocardia takedensis TaxID=259390 RepID=UPI003F75AB23